MPVRDQAEGRSVMGPVASVSVGKAAKALGVSAATVRNWEAKGYIRALRLPSGQRRIPESEIDRILEQYLSLPLPVEASSETKIIRERSRDGVWGVLASDEPTPTGSSGRRRPARTARARTSRRS